MPNLKLQGVPPFPLKTTDTYLLCKSPHSFPAGSSGCEVDGGWYSPPCLRGGTGGTGEHELGSSSLGGGDRSCLTLNYMVFPRSP